MTTSEDIKFIAELSGVTEVTLLGTAHLDYWQDRLRPHGLSPAPCDGAAQILVIAANARFRGIPFSEVSFSLIVSPSQKRHALRDAACLLQAFNSNRFFAFCERTFFATPYNAAKCEISLDPLKVVVSNPQETLFSIQMGRAGPREASPMADDGWYGTVALMSPKRHAKVPHKYFVAKVSGQTTTYPFDASSDTLMIAEESGVRLFSELIESGFEGKRWIIRPSANHAKSKTYLVRERNVLA